MDSKIKSTAQPPCRFVAVQPCTKNFESAALVRIGIFDGFTKVGLKVSNSRKRSVPQVW